MTIKPAIETAVEAHGNQGLVLVQFGGARLLMSRRHFAFDAPRPAREYARPTENCKMCHYSGFPFLELLNVFAARDVLDSGSKADIADGLFDLAAEGGGQGIKVRGGQLGQVPFAEFGFNRGQAFGEGGGALLGRAQQTVLEVVEFEGALVLEFEAELAAPLDECAFGDAQFAGDADEGPAVGAALDEFLTDFGRVHEAGYSTGFGRSDSGVEAGGKSTCRDRHRQKGTYAGREEK